MRKYNLEELVNRVIEYIKQNKKQYINTYEISAICDCSVSYARRIWYVLLHKGVINQDGIINLKALEVEK